MVVGGGERVAGSLLLFMGMGIHGLDRSSILANRETVSSRRNGWVLRMVR